MDELESLDHLMEESEVALIDGDIEIYLNQGGIRRRLKLLAKLSRTLADLHGRGMAFGDLSPANIFVSKSVEDSEVWLIDCDNICVNERNNYDIKYETGRAGTVYTPSYGAPEVVRDEAMVNSLTDSWSFGIIAFRLLTAIHPFIGDVVSDGEPELEDSAYRGELPWIEHPDDYSNQSEQGIPRSLVILKPLAELFEQCFNIGRDEPISRPSLSQWAEVLEHCVEWLVNCHDCKGSYYYALVDKKLNCSFCDSSADITKLIFLKHYLFDQSIMDLPNAKESDRFISTGLRQILNNNCKLEIKSSPPGSVYYPVSKVLYTLKLSTKKLEIIPNKKIPIWIKIGKSKAQKYTQPISLGREKKKILLIANAESEIKDVCIFNW
jgi:serine/threonine protein kinase